MGRFKFIGRACIKGPGKHPRALKIIQYGIMEDFSERHKMSG